MFRGLKEEQVKEAYQREQTEQMALLESSEKLRAKLDSLHIPVDQPEDTEKPCASFREAIATCYRVNGKSNPLACVSDVEAFTECAKQLSKISQ